MTVTPHRPGEATTWGRRAPVAVAILVLSGLGLAGCTGSDEPPSPVPPVPESTAGPDTSSSGSADDTPGRPSTAAPRPRRTEPPPWVTRPSLTRPPAPGATAPPSDRAARRGFPRPADLGPAWTYRQTFGDDTYADPGDPVVLADARDVVRDAVPPGCRPPAREPATEPVRASTLTYEVAGEWVDAVRARFGSRRDASRFADARRRALRDCVGRGAGSAAGPLVTRVVDVDAVTVLSDRTPDSDAYSDLAVLDGATVVLVSRRTERAPTLRAARALAAAFTGSRVPGGIS